MGASYSDIIADEWHSEIAEDKKTLKHALERALEQTPEPIQLLIGTKLIEENYFDSIERL